MSNSIERRTQAFDARVESIVEKSLPKIRRKMAKVEPGAGKTVSLLKQYGSVYHLKSPVGKRLQEELEKDGYSVRVSTSIGLSQRNGLNARVEFRPKMASEDSFAFPAPLEG